MSFSFQTFSLPLDVNNSLLPVSMSNKTPGEILIQEQQMLALVIGVKPFDPNQLTEEFLKQESIIPQNWRQKKNLSSPSKIQLDFEEGITIIGNLNQLIIQETIDIQNLDNMGFSTVAHQLIKTLKNKTYTKIQLQFRRSFKSENVKDFALSYLKKNLLSPPVNQIFQNQLVSGEISYCYQLDNCQFILKVQGSKKPANLSPSLNFIGSFNYNKLTRDKIKIILANWSSDYQRFTQFINDKF